MNLNWFGVKKIEKLGQLHPLKIEEGDTLIKGVWETVVYRKSSSLVPLNLPRNLLVWCSCLYQRDAT